MGLFFLPLVRSPGLLCFCVFCIKARSLTSGGRRLNVWKNLLPKEVVLQLTLANGIEVSAMGPSPIWVSVHEPIIALALVVPAGDSFSVSGARMRLVRKATERSESEIKTQIPGGPQSDLHQCLDPENSLPSYALGGHFASINGTSAAVSSSMPGKLDANVSAFVPLIFKVAGSFQVCYSHDGTFMEGRVDVAQPRIEVHGANTCETVGCLAEIPNHCYVRKLAYSAAGSCEVNVSTHGEAGRIKIVRPSPPKTIIMTTQEVLDENATFVNDTFVQPSPGDSQNAPNCTSSPATLLCADGWEDGSAVCTHGDRYLDLLHGPKIPGKSGFNQSGSAAVLPQTVSDLSGSSFRGYTLAACYCPVYQGCQSEEAYTQQIGLVHFYASKVCPLNDAACLQGAGSHDGFSGVAMGIPFHLVVLCAPSQCVNQSSTRIKLIDLPASSADVELDSHPACGEAKQSGLLVSPSRYLGESWCNVQTSACIRSNVRIFGGAAGFRLENDRQVGAFPRSFLKTRILGVCFCLSGCATSSSWFQVGFVHASPFLWSASIMEDFVMNVPGDAVLHLNGKDIDSLGLNNGGEIKLLPASVATDSMCNTFPGDSDVFPMALQLKSGELDIGNGTNNTNETAKENGEVTQTGLLDDLDAVDEIFNVEPRCSAVYAKYAAMSGPWQDSSNGDNDTNGTEDAINADGGLDESDYIFGFNVMEGLQEGCTAFDPIACPGALSCCERLRFKGKTVEYVLKARTAGVRSVCYCAPPQDCSAPGAQWVHTLPAIIRGPHSNQEWVFPAEIPVRMEVEGVSLSGADSFRIIAPGEKCEGHPCVAQRTLDSFGFDIMTKCPYCEPLTMKPAVCACNREGVQKNAVVGDWCWLADDHEEAPCRLLTGQLISWTWARCVHRGVEQINCHCDYLNTESGAVLDLDYWKKHLRAEEGCIPIAEQPRPDISIQTLGSNTVRCDESGSQCEVVNLVSVVANATSLVFTFSKYPGLNDGDVIVLGQEVTCLSNCNEDQLAAVRGIHLYGGSGRRVAHDLGHKVFRANAHNRRSWITYLQISDPVPTVRANGASWRLLNRVQMLGELVGRHGIRLPVCWRSRDQRWYGAHIGYLSFLQPKVTNARLHLTATKVGVIAPIIISFTAQLSEADEKMLTSATAKVELLVRFREILQLRPVALIDVESARKRLELTMRDGATRSMASVPRTRSKVTQAVCGEWFTEMWADDVQGFPVVRGCSYSPENWGGRTFHVYFDRGQMLKRNCRRIQADGGTIFGQCQYQLVMMAELRNSISASSDLVSVVLMCRSGCSKPYHVAMLSIARVDSTVKAGQGSTDDDPQIQSLELLGADAVMSTVELVDNAAPIGPYVDFALRLSVAIGKDWTSTAIRIFLAPFSLWDIDDCNVTVGRSTTRPCTPEQLGLSHSAISVGLDDPLSQSSHSTTLSFELSPPRFGLGFFATEIFVEVTSEQNPPSAAPPSFSYAFSDGFLWRKPQTDHIVTAFQGASQLVIEGRAGYGPQPFLQEENTLMVKIVVFATTSRLVDPIGAGIDLNLPPGFECLGVSHVNIYAPIELPFSLAGPDYEDLPRGWLRSTTGRLDSWEPLGTKPETCRFLLGEFHSVFAGQVIYVHVHFKNPSSPMSAGSLENQWSITLHSRGSILDASVLRELRSTFSTSSSWQGDSINRFIWQGNIPVLGRMRDVSIHPSHFRPSRASDSNADVPSNDILVFFRLSQLVDSGGSLVVDAPGGFDFHGCTPHDLPEYRYDSYDTGTLQAPRFRGNCTATWWPCLRLQQVLVYDEAIEAHEFCERGPGFHSWKSHEPKNRAILHLAEALHPNVPYGFQMSIGNPAMHSVELQKAGWWLWSRDSDGHGVDGSRVSDNGWERSWSVFNANIEATVTVSGLQPYSVSDLMELVILSLVSPRNGTTDVRVTAPLGYAWGPIHGSLRICPAIHPSASIPPAESARPWPKDIGCTIRKNVVTWRFVSLTAGERYDMSLQVRVPDRTPLMGPNAFYVELGYSKDSLPERWAAGVLSPDVFHVQALSKARISCSCTVAGFNANYICFSLRMPTAIPNRGFLRIFGDEYTQNLVFRSECEVQRCKIPVPGADPLPDGLVCKYKALPGNRPEIIIMAPKTGLPAGFFAFQLFAQNPALPTDVPGTWIFETFGDSEGSRLDRHISVEGFKLRRGMRSAGFLNLSPTMLAAMGGDRRLAHSNRIVLSFVLAEKLSGVAPFHLHIAAPIGFLFADFCLADVPVIPGMQAPFGWPSALTGCTGKGRTALLSISLALKPDIEHIFRISVLNPSGREAQMQSETGEWSLEFLDQASETFPSFEMQMLYDFLVQPVSAAYGAPEKPVFLAFTPFSTVPESPHGRLVLTAPEGFQLSGSICTLKEKGGACENCVAEGGDWCAQNDVCGTTSGSSCPLQYSSRQQVRRGLPACTFQMQSTDVSCIPAQSPEVLILSVKYLGLSGAPRGGFSKGRRYELNIVATNPPVDTADSQWHIRSEIMIDTGANAASWEELDSGEAPGFSLVNPALHWSVINPSCVTAGRGLATLEASLRLSHEVQADHMLEIIPPTGMQWPSPFGYLDCARDLLVAPPQHSTDHTCVGVVREYATPPPIQTSTTKTTSTTIMYGATSVNDTWWDVNVTDDTTSMTVNTSLSSYILYGDDTTATTSTTLGTAINENAVESNESLDNSTLSSGLASQRRLQSSDLTLTTTIDLALANSLLCQSRDCIQCVCTTHCRILLRGLRLTAGAPLRLTISVINPIENPILVDNFWRVIHFSEQDVHQSEDAVISWPVQTQLSHAAVLLTPPDGGPRRVGAVSSIRIEFTPLRAAARFELSTPLAGFDFRSAVVDEGVVIATDFHRLLVRIDLNMNQIRKISIDSVRLGSVGGPTIFSLVTSTATGKIQDELLYFEGFRLPGTLDIVGASLRRDPPIPHPYLPDQVLPARSGELAMLAISFKVGLHVHPGAFLHVLCNTSWSAIGSKPRVIGDNNLQVSGEQVQTLGVCHIVFALNGSLSADATTYTVEFSVLPSSSASPSDQWTLSAVDDNVHPIVTNDGSSLQGLLDPIVAPLEFDMQMGRPPPGGQLRVTFGFSYTNDLPPIVDLVVVPPPGWTGPPVRGRDCIGALEAQAAQRDHTSASSRYLAAEVEIEFGTPCVSDPDTNWFVLASDVGSSPGKFLAWGDGQGTLVAHMRVELRHAGLAGLEATTLVLSFQLGQETEVSSIYLLPPPGYKDLDCTDAGKEYEPPRNRWMMKLKRLQPKCKSMANASSIAIEINASISAGTWSIGLIGTLPTDLSTEASYNVVVTDRFGNLIDAAYAQPAIELLQRAQWRVDAPFLALRQRDQNGQEVVVSIGFQVRDIPPKTNETVTPVNIHAIRIFLPSGLYTIIADVKLDLVITRDGGGDDLPVAQDGRRVTRGTISLLFYDGATLDNGLYDVQFPVRLPGEVPNDNVWLLQFCSDSTCSGESVDFPLVGFSEGEVVEPKNLKLDDSLAVLLSSPSAMMWICLLLMSCAI